MPFLNIYTCSEGRTGLTIHIAQCNDKQVAGGIAEAEANARLIAEAPAMAEALKVFAAAAVWDWDETIWRNVAPEEARILWSEQAKQGITRADLIKARALLARIRGDVACP
jgi:hypothetical protein